MKRFLFVGGLVFAVSLAVVIGTRMSSDAMGVVVGIVCGVLASVPTTSLMVWVLRQREKQEAQWRQSQVGHYPPVVVVNGQGPNGQQGYPVLPSLPASATAAGPRRFKVVGQENTEAMGDVLPSFWEEL
jgi:hypothetical protein